LLCAAAQVGRENFERMERGEGGGGGFGGAGNPFAGFGFGGPGGGGDNLRWYAAHLHMLLGTLPLEPASEYMLLDNMVNMDVRPTPAQTTSLHLTIYLVLAGSFPAAMRRRSTWRTSWRSSSAAARAAGAAEAR
jgi:hypothetical protein